MGFMNGIYEWDISMSHLNCYSDKGLKPQPRDSDMNILGYFEDIKNTANGLL